MPLVILRMAALRGRDFGISMGGSSARWLVLCDRSD
jgi:hypothetical protein